MCFVGKNRVAGSCSEIAHHQQPLTIKGLRETATAADGTAIVEIRIIGVLDERKSVDDMKIHICP